MIAGQSQNVAQVIYLLHACLQFKYLIGNVMQCGLYTPSFHVRVEIYYKAPSHLISNQALKRISDEAPDIVQLSWQSMVR